MSSRLAKDHERLEHLYEVSKLFASFESVEQTFDKALAVIAKTLPLRTAVLIETESGHSKMIVWPSDGHESEEMLAATEHVATAYAYLVGAPSTEALELDEQPGLTALPRSAETARGVAKRFIVIPLVVAHRAPFGALQLEGAEPLGERDLMFVNAIANQLAVALDRDRAWRHDVSRRDVAESSKKELQALADENAKLYEQARQAVRVREQVLAIVSHDLRNPLGTILMAVQAITPEERQRFSQVVGRVERAAERMLRLIEDLLDFASIEAGQLAIKMSAQDPGSLIQETMTSFEGVARDKQLRLTADVEPGLPEIFCDRDRILQVLSNLVGNATQATPEGGHIGVRVKARGQDVLFEVSDDGPGISDEDIRHLFDRYWRSGDARYKGTGLGLAIARGIVVAHGGSIWAQGELGRGASFLFTVRTTDADEPSSARDVIPIP